MTFSKRAALNTLPNSEAIIYQKTHHVEILVLSMDSGFQWASWNMLHTDKRVPLQSNISLPLDDIIKLDSKIP